jgi:hypothetical protein
MQTTPSNPVCGSFVQRHLRPFVLSFCVEAVTDLSRYAQRRRIAGRDHAYGPCRQQRRIRPAQGRNHRFGGQPVPGSPARQHPAGFRSVEWRIDLTSEVGKSDFTDKASGGAIDHDPVPVAQEFPVTDIAKQTRPNLLGCFGAWILFNDSSNLF